MEFGARSCSLVRSSGAQSPDSVGVCCFLLFGALAEFGLSHLRTILQHLFQRERPFPEPLRQGLPFHAFHHQIIDSILMTHVVQNANVRMIQAGNRFGFPLEPLLPDRVTGELCRQNFDGDGAFQPRVAGAIDFPPCHPRRAVQGFRRVRVGYLELTPCWPRFYLRWTSSVTFGAQPDV